MFELSNPSFEKNISKNLVENLKKVDLKVRSVDLSGFTKFENLTQKQKIIATENLLNELDHAAQINEIFHSVKNSLK